MNLYEAFELVWDIAAPVVMILTFMLGYKFGRINPKRGSMTLSNGTVIYPTAGLSVTVDAKEWRYDGDKWEVV